MLAATGTRRPAPPRSLLPRPAVLAGVVGAVVVALLLAPHKVDLPIAWLMGLAPLQHVLAGGSPGWWALEDLANVALFVPVGAVLARWLPAPTALAIGVAGSAACELAQRWIPQRDGSLLDVAMNAAGTALGVLLALRLRRAPARRRTA